MTASIRLCLVSWCFSANGLSSLGYTLEIYLDILGKHWVGLLSSEVERAGSHPGLVVRRDEKRDLLGT